MAIIDGWFRRISNNPDDLVLIADMIQFYEKELEDVNKEIAIPKNATLRLESLILELVGNHTYRLEQYKSLKSIMSLLNIKLNHVESQVYKELSENYSKTLKVTDLKQYVQSDARVAAMKLLLVQVDHLVDQYEGKTEMMEKKHFSLSYIVKLRAAQVEDAVVEYQ